MLLRNRGFIFFKFPRCDVALSGVSGVLIFTDTVPPPLFRGGMIFTFYKARGLKTGKSMVEEDKLDLAKKLEAMAKAKGVELLLPVDVIIADKFDANANDKVGCGPSCTITRGFQRESLRALTAKHSRLV